MRLLLTTLLAASPALADGPLMTDAFGIADGQDFARAEWAGYRETLQGRGQVVAPGPGAAVQMYLGDKSLVAGREQVLAMALVTDARGNLVADGAAVTLTVATDQAQVVTRNGIARAIFGPFTEAGQFYAGAAIAGQQSARQDFVVRADLTGVVPALATVAGPVPAEDFTDITTAPLTDRFGNGVSDGTGLTVLVTGADGSTTVLPGVVVGGVGRARVLARDMAAEGAVRGALGAEVSAPQALDVAALRPLGMLEIKARPMDDIGATALVVGPFLTKSGHLLNDGAEVRLGVTTPKGALPEQRAWVLDGEVRFTVLIGADDFPITVTATSPLGQAQRVIKRQGLVP